MQSITYASALDVALHKVGPKVLRDLEASSAPTKAALQTVKRTGEVALKRIKVGENRSFGFMADGAATAAGQNVGFETYSSIGKIFFGKIVLDRAAATQAAGNAATTADLVMSEIESAGKGAMRQLNHAIINGSNEIHTLVSGDLTAINACTSAVPATITGALATAVRVGQSLDLYDDSGSAVLRKFYVTGRLPNFDTGTHTATFSCDEAAALSAGTPAAAGDYFVVNGSLEGASTVHGITGLRDIVGSADLFGLSSTTVPAWQGTRVNIGGALAPTDFRTFKATLRNKAGNGNLGKNFWLMNTNRLRDVYELGDAKSTYQDTKVTIGDYESINMVAGDAIVVDESMLDGSVFYIDRNDVKLAVFKEMFQDGDGAPGSDHGKMHFIPSPSALTYEAEMWGVYNLEADARHTSGELYGITG